MVELEDGDETDLAEALRGLPLCDDVFLGMQAMNIDLVDDVLSQYETDLLHEYIEAERTPIPAAMFVGALSQMWIFAVYEFLRTWRQHAAEMLAWARELEEIDPDERDEILTAKRREIEQRASEARDADVRWQGFEKASEEGFADFLRAAIDRTESLFRSVEALRMNLAKHEVPRRRGVYALSPGYGRIDMETGSITWQVALGEDEVAMVSRQDIANACRSVAGENDRILRVPVQDQMLALPKEGYGVKRVAVALDDGSEYAGVWVAWCKEVIRVQGHEGIPFDVSRVVGVRHDPLPDEDAPVRGG